MQKIEYWKFGTSILEKISENGVFLESVDINKDNPKYNEILSKLKDKDFFVEFIGDPFAEVDKEEEIAESSLMSNASEKDVNTESDEEMPPIKKFWGEDDMKKTKTEVDTTVSDVREEVTDSSVVSSEVSESSGSTKEYDFVNAPSHYNGHTMMSKDKGLITYESVDYMEARVNRLKGILNPDESGAVYTVGKYYDRFGEKPEEGKTVREKAAEDLEKISWYALRAANLIRKNGIQDLK